MRLQILMLEYYFWEPNYSKDVLALALPLIMVITRFHTVVSRERICIPIRGNFPLSGNLVNIFFIYSERLGIFLSNSEILINVSNISAISAFVQITFTYHYILFTVFRIRNRNLHWGCPFVNKVGQYLINLVMQLFLKTCSGF